jgi:hypothetical protein
VTALFNGANYASERSRYTVGVVPPNWPADLVPAPPVTVVGGMFSGNQRIAVFVDSTTRHPLESLRRQLETTGWARPRTELLQGFISGFQEDEARVGFLCRDSVRALLASTRSTGGLTYVRVGLETMRGEPCVPRTRAAVLDAPTLRLPLLFAPPGIRTTGGESGSTGRTTIASTRLADSTISAATLLAHYGAQLVKAGWTVHPPTTTAAFATQALETRDKDGVSWYGMMLVIPTSSSRDVSIMMNRTSSR